MKWRANILPILQVLVPVLFMVAFFGVRFRQIPIWARDVYPFVLWPLLVLVVVLAVVYLVDTRRKGQETPLVLWYVLAMSGALVAISLLENQRGEWAQYIVLALVGLVVVLYFAAFGRAWVNR